MRYLGKVIMDVKSNSLAILSLILNAVFITYYLELVPAQVPTEQHKQLSLERSNQHDLQENTKDSRGDLFGTDVLHGYYQKLISQGLSAEQTKPLIFAKLKHQYIATITKPNDQFWKHQPLAQLDYMESLSTGYKRVREKLVSIYGSTILDDPLVTDIFYPMSTQYPFLSSSEQIAVQSMQLEMQRYAVSVQSQGGDVNSRSADRSPQKMLANVLDDRGLKEYQLRTSPMANKMRQSGVEFSETSFRKAYDILLRLNSARDSQVVFSARDDLNDLLGDESGLTLWAAIDPVYSLIKRVASKHDVNDGQALYAYELVLVAKKEVSEAAQQRDSDPQQTVYIVQEILTNLKNQLTEMVGEPAANDFINLVNGRQRPSPIRR